LTSKIHFSFKEQEQEKRIGKNPQEILEQTLLNYSIPTSLKPLEAHNLIRKIQKVFTGE